MPELRSLSGIGPGRCVGACLAIGLVGLLGLALHTLRAEETYPPVDVGEYADDESESRASVEDPPPAPSTAPDAPLQQRAAWRHPVALAWADGGRLICTANRRSGTMTIIDRQQLAVVAEQAVGERLSDLVALRDDHGLLATDEQRHEVLWLRRTGLDARVVARAKVAQYPVSVRASEDGTQCFVASLWSRTVTVLALVAPSADLPPRFEVVRTYVLPFAPRKQLWLEQQRRLIVADAFGGRIAVIDPQASEPVSVQSAIRGHNIGGLLLTNEGQTLLVSYQSLNSLARTEFNDVHWGVFITNLVRELSVASLVERTAAPPNLRGFMAGEVGAAGGDPAEMALAPGGRFVIALSGVGAVSVAQPDKAIQYRLRAGVRPQALLSEGDGSRVVVADALGDRVYVLDVVADRRLAAITLGPQPELTAGDRGERLFYNARLSHDGWMSCHSCHPDGHTNDLTADNFSDNSFAAPKRVLSLLGVADTAPWAWNGAVDALSVQVQKSVVSTMQGRRLGEHETADLVQYLQSLPPAPALAPLVRPGDAAAFERGRTVFFNQGCQECHAPPTYTSARTYDVGLTDELGNTKFNPPSLRGVSQRDAFFHNASAQSLEDVLVRDKHQFDDETTPEELADLLHFLRSI